MHYIRRLVKSHANPGRDSFSINHNSVSYGIETVGGNLGYPKLTRDIPVTRHPVILFPDIAGHIAGLLRYAMKPSSQTDSLGTRKRKKSSKDRVSEYSEEKVNLTSRAALIRVGTVPLLHLRS